MVSTRLVQLSLLLVMVVVLPILERPSFPHTDQLGITEGRKMLVNQLSHHRIKRSNKMPEGSVSKISGNGAVGSKNVPLEIPEKYHMNVQVEKLDEPKAESTLKAHQHEGANYYNKKYESKEFVEVANLMWKDYSGRARPRRKPPVHNYNPTTKH